MSPTTRQRAGSGKRMCRFRSTMPIRQAPSDGCPRIPERSSRGRTGAPLSADDPDRTLDPSVERWSRSPGTGRASGASRLLRALLLEEVDALSERRAEGRLDVAALDGRDDHLADEVPGLRDVGDGERSHAGGVDLRGGAAGLQELGIERLHHLRIDPRRLTW